MKKKNFYYLINNFFLKLENKIENNIYNLDIDVYIQQNTMTITFLNKKKIILNSKEYLKQIWMATEKKGFQFEYLENNWICKKNKKKIEQILEKEFKINTGKKIEIL